MTQAGRKRITTAIIVILWLFVMGAASYHESTQAMPEATNTPDPNLMSPTPTLAPMSAENLIKLVNQARMSHRLPALVVDPILMQTAQTTADIMAGNRMTGHIGDVRSRVMAAGYGVGDIPWATENFVVLPLGAESKIMTAWADDIHQIPMVNPNYRHVGAGVAVVGDTVYYVLHAAYTSNKIYQPADQNTGGIIKANNLISQYIYAVQTVTPRPDGSVVHTVKNGQSLWAIAIAYNVHIEDIKKANNLPQSLEMVYEGQQLIIPLPVGPSSTPEVSPTFTQMVVFTETPTRPTGIKQSTPSGQTISVETNMNVSGNQENEHASMQDIILYSIGGAVILGLILIVVGAVSGHKKDQDKQ